MITKTTNIVLVSGQCYHINSDNTHKMAQIHVANRQNPLMSDVDINHNVDMCRQWSCSQLGRSYVTNSQDYDGMLDQSFRIQCMRIATGYAWAKKAMIETGRLTFKTAVRQDRHFQNLPPQRKKIIHREIKHITSIVENWQAIVHHCTLPWMVNYQFVELENKKDDTKKRNRSLTKEYNIHQVNDIVDNRQGATEAILNQVDRDPDQIDLFCEDLKIAFHRRSQGLI